MASRRFTVDPVKKKELINIFLLMPETRVDDAMRKAEFTEKDATAKTRNARFGQAMRVATTGRSAGSCQRRRRIRRGCGNRITVFLAQWRLACL